MIQRHDQGSLSGTGAVSEPSGVQELPARYATASSEFLYAAAERNAADRRSKAVMVIAGVPMTGYVAVPMRHPVGRAAAIAQLLNAITGGTIVKQDVRGSGQGAVGVSADCWLPA